MRTLVRALPWGPATLMVCGVMGYPGSLESQQAVRPAAPPPALPRIGSWIVRDRPSLETRRTSIMTGETLTGATRLRGSVSAGICPASAGGPRVEVSVDVHTSPRDSLGYTRIVRADSRGFPRRSAAEECAGVMPEEVGGFVRYRDRLELRRDIRDSGDAHHTLIIQTPWKRGPRVAISVRANGRPVPSRDTSDVVGVHAVGSAEIVTIDLSHDVPTALPPPPEMGSVCDDCLPRRIDSSGVSIATVAQAMDLTGLPHATRRGWTTVHSVLSRSALRETVLRHVQSMGTGCTIHPALDSSATVQCSPPTIRFVAEGVELEIRARPVRWMQGVDTTWSRLRLLYPIRQVQGALSLREASHVEMVDPLQVVDAGVVQRLSAGSPLVLLPLTWELRARYSRLFGNVCLTPDPDRAAAPGIAIGDGDVLHVRFDAPVMATMSDECRLPFPTERPPASP